MKTTILLGAIALLSGSILAADSGPKQDVIGAAKNLGDKANYSWKTTVTVPEGTQFRPGPIEGKTEKDGFTILNITVRDNTRQAVLKGNKGAVTDQDGAWQSLADQENSEGRGRFLAMMVRNFKAPAAQAVELASGAKELNKEGDVYAGQLTEDAAKTLLRFRRGGDGPTVNNAKGSVKFWVKDGLLSKYEFKVQGSITFNNNDVDVDRTTVVEIKDVGATKVEVPAEAKSKLS
jgi:hypothetical protein